MVTGNSLSPHVARYAIKVAVRLDLDIMLLFVGENSLIPDEQEEQVVRFRSKAEKVATEFTDLARKSSVSVTTVIDLDERKEAIRRARQGEANIRFILTDEHTHRADESEEWPHPHLEVIRTS